MTTPETRSLEQKLLSQSRNVFVVVLLTYLPFSVIAYVMLILANALSLLATADVNPWETAINTLPSSTNLFFLGWSWVMPAFAQPHIIVPIAWGLCCLYHRRLVFNLPRKTFWFFASALLFFWVYTPLQWIYRSRMREDWESTSFGYLLIAVSTPTVLFCWWLVERWRAKILPEE